MRAKYFLSTMLFALSMQPVSAATFVVNSLSDDNAGDSNPGDGICEDLRGGKRCTLRAALEESNFAVSFDTIHFNVGSFFVINLESPLPNITRSVHIDGRTEAGYNSAATDIAQAPPRVYLNGSALGATAAADGLRVLAYARVDALGFIHFPDSGIEARSSSVDINNCWIGLAGNGAIAGNGRGIFLDQVDGAKIGQHFVGNNLQGLGNVISANAGDGIYVLIGEDNLIAGNRIGTSPDGSGNRGNGGDGIELVGPNNEIGSSRGIAAGVFVRAGNRIGYNVGHGVNAALGGQQIETNDIVANGGAGVLLAGTGSNIGSDNFELQGNFIHGNGNAGVQLSGSSHVVRNNELYQNAGRGVDATAGSGHQVALNGIYGNGSDGVRVASSASYVASNDIGRSNSNSPMVPNLGNGVLLEASGNLLRNNRIGGAPGSEGDGVEVRSGDGNEISANHIGVYEQDNIGNAEFGIRVGATATNTLIEGNHVGFNGGGIALLGSGTRLCANRIGMSNTGAAAGNLGEGVYVEGSGNFIGAAPLGCDGNFIVRSGSSGIILRGSGQTIADNLIGGSGTGNSGSGIKVDIGAENNLIARNNFGHNGADGVRLVTGAGNGNRIEANTFDNNGDIGIDISDDGITENDSSDNDSGPNNTQNFPIWIGATTNPAPGQVRVDYWVDSTSANAAYPLQVQFYLNSGLRQGLTYLHTATYPTVGVTRFATITLPAGVISGNLTAIVIDDDGNTSEFSGPLSFAVVPLVDNMFKNGFESP